MQFNVGNNVVLKKDTEDGKLLKGATGIVVSQGSIPESLGVSWDGFTEGHSCYLVKDIPKYSCWFVYTNNVELLEEEENE